MFSFFFLSPGNEKSLVPRIHDSERDEAKRNIAAQKVSELLGTREPSRINRFTSMALSDRFTKRLNYPKPKVEGEEERGKSV